MVQSGPQRELVRLYHALLPRGPYITAYLSLQVVAVSGSQHCCRVVLHLTKRRSVVTMQLAGKQTAASEHHPPTQLQLAHSVQLHE